MASKNPITGSFHEILLRSPISDNHFLIDDVEYTSPILSFMEKDPALSESYLPLIVNDLTIKMNQLEESNKARLEKNKRARIDFDDYYSNDAAFSELMSQFKLFLFALGVKKEGIRSDVDESLYPKEIRPAYHLIFFPGSSPYFREERLIYSDEPRGLVQCTLEFNLFNKKNLMISLDSVPDLYLNEKKYAVEDWYTAFNQIFRLKNAPYLKDKLTNKISESLDDFA